MSREHSINNKEIVMHACIRKKILNSRCVIFTTRQAIVKYMGVYRGGCSDVGPIYIQHLINGNPAKFELVVSESEFCMHVTFCVG